VLVAIELITMPLTQYLWTWDHFLHGGRDFEMNLLMTVTFLCFGLLRAQHSGKHLKSMFAIGVSRSTVGKRDERRSIQRIGRPCTDAQEDIPNIFPTLFSPPLLI